MNLNERYFQLCAMLGDLLMNRDHLDAKIEAVKREIRELNLAAENQHARKQEPQSEG